MINLVSEIGINYAYGDSKSSFIENAKALIDISYNTECTHVKFQKRNPDLSTPENKKNEKKIVPWSNKPITYLEYKKDIEFSIDEIEYLFSYAKEKGLIPFASVWDIDSAKELKNLTDIVKIPSAHVTNEKLLRYCGLFFKNKIISTGMSTQNEVDSAISILDPSVIMHTNSTYPTPLEDLNLGYLKFLKKTYPSKEIGYSNHCDDIIPLIVSSTMGANWIEFHVTKNRNFWGSDQKSSFEEKEISKITNYIHTIEKSIKDGNKPRLLLPGENEKKSSLRII